MNKVYNFSPSPGQEDKTGECSTSSLLERLYRLWIITSWGLSAACLLLPFASFPTHGTPLPELTVDAEEQPVNQPLLLEIADVVQLVIENNTDIRNAYLDRIAQRQDLIVAEDKFNPNLTPRVLLNARRQTNDRIINQNQGLEVGAEINTRLPIGSEINLNWQTVRLLQQDFGSTNDINQRSLNHQVQLQLKQPLLRGAGVRVNRASIERARISDRISRLDVKATLIDRVTQAILLYRQLLQRQEELKISQLNLDNSRRLLEVTEALIDAGKRAPIERIEGEAGVATQELNVLAAKNDLDRARLNLLNLLELDQSLLIVAEYPTSEEPPSLDREQLLALAVENNPAYRQAQLNQEVVNYNLIEAADRRRWALDLETEYNWLPSNQVNSRSDLSVALTLSQTLGDLAPQQQFQQSQVNFLKAENTLSREYSRLTIDISDRLRNIELSLEQVKQSQTARELAQQQLEIEETKINLNISSRSLTDIIGFQNALATAQQSELNALINYLNALTNLDQVLGLTLERWNLNLEIE